MIKVDYKEAVFIAAKPSISLFEDFITTRVKDKKSSYLYNIINGKPLIDISDSGDIIRKLKLDVKTGDAIPLTSNCFKDLINFKNRVELVTLEDIGLSYKFYLLDKLIKWSENIFTGIHKATLELITFKYENNDIVVMNSFVSRPDLSLSFLANEDVKLFNYLMSIYCISYFSNSVCLIPLFLNNQKVVKELFSQNGVAIQNIYCISEVIDSDTIKFKGSIYNLFTKEENKIDTLLERKGSNKTASDLLASFDESITNCYYFFQLT